MRKNLIHEHRKKDTNVIAKARTFITSSRTNLIVAVVVALAVVGAGSYMFISRASGFFASTEPEVGTLSGNAQVVIDSGAAGGKAIQFNAPAAPPPPPPPSGGGGTGPATCPAFPAFPDQNCTGYKHTTGYTSESQLTRCKENDGEEDGHLMKANMVYDRCLMSGKRIRAANITIQNSKIIGTLMPPNTNHEHKGDYQGLKVIDVEITPFTDAELAGWCQPANWVTSGLPCDTKYGFTPMGDHNFRDPYSTPDSDPRRPLGQDDPIAQGDNMSCLRCYIHHGAKSTSAGTNSSYTDSFIDGNTWTTAQHGAGAGTNYGLNAKFIHNNISCYRWNTKSADYTPGCSSALSIYDEGKLDGVEVRNNLFNSQGGFCVYTGGPTGKNVKFIDNYFGKRFFPRCGPEGVAHSWYPNNIGYEWRGNVWADGSGVVNP